MKKFNLKNTAVLSILAIAFVFTATSCKKHRVKKDIDGTWNIESMMADGQDVSEEFGMSLNGTWTFDKKNEKCTQITTYSILGEDYTEQTEMDFEVTEKDEIQLGSVVFKIHELTDNRLTLNVQMQEQLTSYNFTR